MKLDLTFGSSFCYPPTFVINDVSANPRDFGTQGDAAPGEAEGYACADMRFERIPATPEVLAKYGISGPEYELVAGQLEVGLSFGACGWCV